jgi:hypothetical protein
MPQAAWPPFAWPDPMHGLAIDHDSLLKPQPRPHAAGAEGFLAIQNRADPLGQSLVPRLLPRSGAGPTLPPSVEASPRETQRPTHEAERSALGLQPVDLCPRWRIRASVFFRISFSSVSWPTLHSSSRTRRSRSSSLRPRRVLSAAWPAARNRSRQANSWAWLRPWVQAHSMASPPRSSSSTTTAFWVGVQRFRVRVNSAMCHLLVEPPQCVTVRVYPSRGSVYDPLLSAGGGACQRLARRTGRGFPQRLGRCRTMRNGRSLGRIYCFRDSETKTGEERCS